MLIEKISVENNKDTSGAVFATVALREVIVAQTRSTSLPPYAHQQEKDKTAEDVYKRQACITGLSCSSW